MVVSIQLVSPASGEAVRSLPATPVTPIKGFHSISFPSEWGGIKGFSGSSVYSVSIQLVSPASGEPKTKKELATLSEKWEFPFN